MQNPTGVHSLFTAILGATLFLAGCAPQHKQPKPPPPLSDSQSELFAQLLGKVHISLPGLQGTWQQKGLSRQKHLAFRDSLYTISQQTSNDQVMRVHERGTFAIKDSSTLSFSGLKLLYSQKGDSIDSFPLTYTVSITLQTDSLRMRPPNQTHWFTYVRYDPLGVSPAPTGL